VMSPRGRRGHSRRRTTAVAVGAVFAVACVALPIAAVVLDGHQPASRTVARVPAPPAGVPGAVVTARPPDGPVPDGPVPASPVPGGAASRSGSAATPVGDPTTTWARQRAGRLGMGWPALRAYGRAQLSVRASNPACRVTWTTLAAIGWVETHNGTYGGSVVGADGVVRPTIVGPALDGAGGRALVRSTDGGALDGDRVYDRAVGPMQFIPTTWRSYGRGNPSDFDAAAAAAARYLCAVDDAASSSGWRRAVLAYNRSDAYVGDVYAAAQWYAANSK
jgi:hypothetical protein